MSSPQLAIRWGRKVGVIQYPLRGKMKEVVAHRHPQHVNNERWFLWQHCARKLRYALGLWAWATALLTGEGMRAYKCDYCRGWHLGHKNETKPYRT